MTLDTAAPGLRERKRLATRRAIQLAVIDLVSQRGLDNVTVDEVSRVADVSPRTFFNYFASKEEALIGEGPSLPSEESVAAFVSAGAASDILVDLGELFADAVDDIAPGEYELNTRRRELLKDHPQLFAIRMANMRHFEDGMTAIVEQRLVADDTDDQADPRELAGRAKLITLMASAAMKHAWTHWADSGANSDLATRLRQSFSEMRQVLN